MAPRDLIGVVKTCGGCHRELQGLNFVFNTQSDDGLTDDCRTCRSYRPKGYPTADQADQQEADMAQVFRMAVARLLAAYPEVPQEEVVEYHRSEFEELVSQFMRQQKLLDKWKPPIWVNKMSLAEYDG